jgi:hypothetical protein
MMPPTLPFPNRKALTVRFLKQKRTARGVEGSDHLSAQTGGVALRTQATMAQTVFCGLRLEAVQWQAPQTGARAGPGNPERLYRLESF